MTDQRYKKRTNYVTGSELNNNEIIIMIKIANKNHKTSKSHI